MIGRKQIAKYIGFPFQDLYKSTDILSVNKFLEESQYWSSDKIEEYQFQKIKKLIENAYSTVDFYKNSYNQHGVKPGDIKDFADMKKLPIITKKDVRENTELFVNKSLLGKNITKTKTGGTTGTPLTLYKDINTRTYTWAAYYRWFKWMGLEMSDSKMSLWGSSSVLSSNKFTDYKKDFINYILNHKIINSFKMNDSNLKDLVKMINSSKPEILSGYLSAMLKLAQFVNENDLKIHRPKAITTTTETLLPPYRKFIEETFNTPLFDQYGAGECQSIAFECAEHNGLHVTSEHVYIEILDNNYEPTSSIGNLIVTDLDNYAMPFIRYEVGDRAQFIDKKCACGVNLPLISHVSGRTADTIILKDGSEVHGVFFTDILYDINKSLNQPIRRFQVVQDKIGEIEFKIESSKELDSTYESAIENGLARFFNNVKITVLPQLEADASGKFRYVISSVNTKQKIDLINKKIS